MGEQVQARLELLRGELGTGQTELEKVERQRTHLRETLLRIGGAILGAGRAAGQREQPMSEGHTESAQDIIQADDLVTELLETTEAVFTLRNKTISGPLDLRYHTIHTAVDIQQCYFQGDVDLRWCNFEQAVDFSKYTFHQAFNKVDQTDSQTINCKKDFNCAEAILEGPVSLDRARIEGSATFKKAQFKSSQEAVDFIGFAATMQLNCNEAVFNRPATFNLLECGRGGLFNGATFEGEVDFVSASFDSNLECTGATFKKSANFNLLKSKDDGNFGGTKFEGEVDFSNASFDSGLNCSWHKEHGATAFKGAV